MEYRSLGNTGFQASRIGAGDLADRSLPIEVCVATLQRAIAWGVNIIDTAPGYEDGYSEEIVGRAIAHRRDQLFVVTKIDELQEAVEPQLYASLDRLQTDYVDGYVYHGLSDMDTYLALREREEGFRAVNALKARGFVRNVGISSHNPTVLMQALRDGVCDIAMFPVGPFVHPQYIQMVLPEAKARGVGSICFKTFGAGKLVTDTTGYGQPLVARPRGKLSAGAGGSSGSRNMTVADCVQYTLTHDPDVALIGMSFPAEQDMVRAAYESFRPADHAELTRIEQCAADARQGKGPCWWNPDPDA
ncbi:MAG: hypothetical protein RLY87_2235 [Chloroflexota bacterium]